MLELPRALILDGDQDFSSAVAGKLRQQSPEIGILQVSHVSSALTALEKLRPHIVFLDWNDHFRGERPSSLLRKMSDLMAADPAGYDYPLLVNSNWRDEYDQDWSERGVIFQMENPRVVIGRGSLVEAESVLSRWYVRKIQPRRVIRLTKAHIDLGRSAYLRIADGPSRIFVWDTRTAKEQEFERHRDDTFQMISQQIISPLSQIESVAAASSLFVKANQRSVWVNLAYVQAIGFDAAGERNFVFRDATAQRLNLTVAHSVARTLEAMRHLALWPHLSGLSLPG